MSHIKILILSFATMLFPSVVSAEITYPYTLDEKPQALFGDTAVVVKDDKTYHGLENYTEDYVNGYARFSFSYTHHRCCYAGYPPRIYVTDSDPRNSTSTLVKYNQAAYQLYVYWAEMGNPTDWYQYEITFDSTGLTTSVKQGGTTEIYNSHIEIESFSDSDWVAIANTYPKQDPLSEYSVAFAPVRVSTNIPPHEINPVIIIPGIMGSAKKNGELLIDPILHTYDDLIATLEANGYQKEKNLFTFPYEWRDSNVVTARLLKDKISAVQTLCETAKANNEITTDLGQTDCSKVDLVAHSMGGLVARQYIQSVQFLRNIDQLIFLGTPHNGSPQAYLQWEAGEFKGGVSDFMKEQFFVSEARRNGYESIFDYIRNRPISSVEELLPTFDYLKDDETGILRKYPYSYPQNSFLEHLNSNILRIFYASINITNIVGNTGNNTIEKIRVVPTSSDAEWVHGEAVSYDLGPGDGTVTTYGATLDHSIINEEFPGVGHLKLPRETSARIFNLFTNKIASNVIYLSPVEKIFSIQLQSPIDMLITAPDGKRMGKNFETGGEYAEIPGAFYSGFGTDEEYITIPNPLDGEYKIQLQGTGDGGEFGVVTSYISDDSTTTKEYTDTIKPDEIKETTAVISDKDNILSLEIKTEEIEETEEVDEIIPPTLPPPSSGSSSGSSRRGSGEVLGASTIEDTRALQLKLIEYLNQLIQLYMLLLKNN